MEELEPSLLSALDGKKANQIYPPEEQLDLESTAGEAVRDGELGVSGMIEAADELEVFTNGIRETESTTILVDMIGLRKRKLAIFAAADAVLAIQTVLVAMPEIWQPLEDDESVKKVAYQEGLHSWFGALNCAASVLCATNRGGDGGWWVKPRSGVWFNTFLMNSHDDERWLNTLRMKRETFLWITNSLEVHVRKQDTKWRPSIPVTVRVGATIYRLVKGANYYELADKFGIGESSVHEIIGDCVPAIVKMFGHHLSFSVDAAIAEVSNGFYEQSGLSSCQGTLDSCHVEIINPGGSDVKHYCNKTGHFSIVLQAVCDTSFIFLHVFCGFPGSSSNSTVLQNSGLYEQALPGQVVTAPIQPIKGGFHLRPYLLAGTGFPLCPWLMSPYSTTPTLSASPPRLPFLQEQFNAHHEQGKQHTQYSFSILKQVFRVLGNGIRGRLELAPTIVHACCILYNIMIRREDLDVKSMVLQLQAL